MPDASTMASLLATVAMCVAAALMGLPFADGRRAAISEAFLANCSELRALGRMPRHTADAPSGERDLAAWYARAVESARSGWLSGPEASALREASVSCGSSPETVAAWASDRQGSPRRTASVASVSVGACSGAIVAACATAVGQPAVAALSPALAAAASALTASDLRYRTIPVPPMAVLALAGVASWVSLGGLAATLAVALAVTAAMWVTRTASRAATGTVPIGAGDVRLCLASLLCAGSRGAVALLLTMLASCVAVLAWGKATGRADRRTQMPLGPVLAAGAAIGMATSLLSMA